MCLQNTYAMVRSFDIVVYGGTAGGVIAATAAAREGATVGLFERSSHLGGMVSGGLGWTDYGTQSVIGGMSLEFFERVGSQYGQSIAWTFEPHAAESVFVAMAREANVAVFYNQRVRELTGVYKSGTRISGIIMQNGDTVTAKVFCDASYDGDVMAQAGVAYTWGRESSSLYGESLAGVRPRTTAHQFPDAISPYDTGTALLPEISGAAREADGTGDTKVQSYNFRLCLTKNIANRVSFTRPAGYDSTRYKLLARYINYLVAQGTTPLPSHVAKLDVVYGSKTDVNNQGPFSSDYIGHSGEYPDASYTRKAEIWNEHEQYLRGFWYFLGHDPSLPGAFRDTMNLWGLARDEFTDNNNWPFQMYIREARRMIGGYVMTQKDIQTERTKADAIGMGSYNSDSHHVQRIINANGHVENEGDMQVGVQPYEIPYGIMLPKRGEATNLLVTSCFSASHVAYSTLRMEPQYMITGHAAGVAAKMAIDANTNVQDINIQVLRLKLNQQKAYFLTPVDAGIIMDCEWPDSNGIVTITGDWVTSTSTPGYNGSGYMHDNNAGKGSKSVRYTPQIDTAGQYDVYMRWTAYANRAGNVPVSIVTAQGTTTVTVDQTTNGVIWQKIGSGVFRKGMIDYFEIRTTGTNGYVIADAVLFVPAWATTGLQPGLPEYGVKNELSLHVQGKYILAEWQTSAIVDKKGKLCVYDMRGRLVGQWRISRGRNALRTGILAHGKYMAQLAITEKSDNGGQKSAVFNLMFSK